MRRRFFITTAAACALLSGAVGPAQAQQARLDAAEIEDLLTGNTAEGRWDGAAYRSYFDPDGTTVYAPADGEAQKGKWRINDETSEYESFFAAIGWTGYAVLHTDDGFAWKHKGKTYPFELVEGRDLTF